MLKINMSKLCLSLVGSTFPELEKIPAMQRRRLSPIAKLALNSALASLENDTVDYIVWVSQYGDENKTFKILEDVLQGQMPSPTQFSTSVHNAISGLYSILCQDATPATSLAGTWNDGLIEAYSWLKTSRKKNAQVLLVFYDESMHSLYAESHEFDAFALAAVISLGNENLIIDLSQFKPTTRYHEQVSIFYEFWNNPTLIQEQGWVKA